LAKSQDLDLRFNTIQVQLLIIYLQFLVDQSLDHFIAAIDYTKSDHPYRQSDPKCILFFYHPNPKLYYL